MTVRRVERNGARLVQDDAHVGNVTSNTPCGSDGTWCDLRSRPARDKTQPIVRKKGGTILGPRDPTREGGTLTSCVRR